MDCPPSRRTCLFDVDCPVPVNQGRTLRPLIAGVLLGLGALTGLPGATWGQLPADSCRAVHFTARVVAGQAFQHDLGGGLLFRLVPSRDPAISGWVIEVHPEHDRGPDSERSWVATPPYRFWNPRYLDTSYGWTAEAVVAANVREFAFIADSASHAAAVAAARVLLWPAGIADSSLVAARATLDAAPRALASLRIVDASIEGNALASMSVEVDACVPTGSGGRRPVPGPSRALLDD